MKKLENIFAPSIWSYSLKYKYTNDFIPVEKIITLQYSLQEREKAHVRYICRTRFAEQICWNWAKTSLRKEKRSYIYGKNDKNSKMLMESKFTIADP